MRHNVVFIERGDIMEHNELARQTMLKLIELQDKVTKEEISYFKGIIEGIRLAGDNNSSFRRE